MLHGIWDLCSLTRIEPVSLLPLDWKHSLHQEEPPRKNTNHRGSLVLIDRFIFFDLAVSLNGIKYHEESE